MSGSILNHLKSAFTILISVLLLAGLPPEHCAAIIVPTITIDDACLVTDDPGNTFVTGHISIAAGQTIQLLDVSGETMLREVTAAAAGTSAPFRLQVPEDRIHSDPGSISRFQVRSLPSPGVAASKAVPVEITFQPAGQPPAKPKKPKTPPKQKKPKKPSKPKKPKKPVMIKKKEKRVYRIVYHGNGATGGQMKKQTCRRGRNVRLKANAFTRSGYRFAGWSLRKGRNAVTMKSFQVGKVRYRNRSRVKNLAATGKTIHLYACWEGNGARAACDWAKLIAADNRFNYGAKPITSRHGCYYCGTNGGKVRRAGGDRRYYRTYVCMTFVNAAYVHGARESRMKCTWRSGRCLDGLSRLSPNMKHLGHVFHHVGKPKRSKLKPGDVLLAYKNGKNHTAMYIGSGSYAQATHRYGSWSKRSIIIEPLSEGSYRYFDAVLRYRG